MVDLLSEIQLTNNSKAIKFQIFKMLPKKDSESTNKGHKAYKNCY